MIKIKKILGVAIFSAVIAATSIFSASATATATSTGTITSGEMEIGESCKLNLNSLVFTAGNITHFTLNYKSADDIPPDGVAESVTDAADGKRTGKTEWTAIASFGDNVSTILAKGAPNLAFFKAGSNSTIVDGVISTGNGAAAAAYDGTIIKCPIKAATKSPKIMAYYPPFDATTEATFTATDFGKWVPTEKKGEVTGTQEYYYLNDSGVWTSVTSGTADEYIDVTDSKGKVKVRKAAEGANLAALKHYTAVDVMYAKAGKAPKPGVDYKIGIVKPKVGLIWTDGSTPVYDYAAYNKGQITTASKDKVKKNVVAQKTQQVASAPLALSTSAATYKFQMNATGIKPASAITELAVAAQPAAATAAAIEIDGVKVKLDKAFEVWDATKKKWVGLKVDKSKLTQTFIIRAKGDTKGLVQPGAISATITLTGTKGTEPETKDKIVSYAVS